MPPPPGLNEIHVRSLEDLQLKFLNLRINSPDMGPDHFPLPLHWWLLVGMGFIALLMMGNLARRRRLMQTADTTFGRPATPLQLDLRVENVMPSRLAAKNVSEAIASGNDQGESIDFGLRRVPKHWGKPGSGTSSGRESRTHFLPSDGMQDGSIFELEAAGHVELSFRPLAVGRDASARNSDGRRYEWESAVEYRLVDCYESTRNQRADAHFEKSRDIPDLTHLCKSLY